MVISKLRFYIFNTHIVIILPSHFKYSILHVFFIHRCGNTRIQSNSMFTTCIYAAVTARTLITTTWVCRSVRAAPISTRSLTIALSLALSICVSHLLSCLSFFIEIEIYTCIFCSALSDFFFVTAFLPSYKTLTDIHAHTHTHTVLMLERAWVVQPRQAAPDRGRKPPGN